MKIGTLLLTLTLGLFAVSCKKKGCTTPSASNFDIEAEENDGSCVFPDTGGVRIWAVVASPDASEAVTLINTADSTIDINGWTIGDKDNPFAYVISNESIASNDTKTYMASELGILINDSHEVIYLKNDEGEDEDEWDN